LNAIGREGGEERAQEVQWDVPDVMEEVGEEGEEKDCEEEEGC
jgi:hypothetical protein